jgi:hypothetical protein
MDNKQNCPSDIETNIRHITYITDLKQHMVKEITITVKTFINC